MASTISCAVTPGLRMPVIALKAASAVAWSLANSGVGSADADGPQHLPGRIPERAGELDEHHVAAFEPARRMMLRRHGQARLGHAGAADEMNDGRAAERVIIPLDQRAQFALAHSGARAAQQGVEAHVAEGGADAHPRDFFVRLAQPQPAVIFAEVDEVEGGELARMQPGQQPDDADALGAAAVQFPRDRRHAGALRPTDLGVAGDFASVGNMVVVLDEQNIPLARSEQGDRPCRRRPARQPAHARPGAFLAAQQNGVARAPCRRVGQRVVAPGKFGVGKTSERLREDVLDPRLLQSRVVHHRADSDSSCPAKAGHPVNTAVAILEQLIHR
ncbi:MAG TPA: hypothetical protein VGZ49_09590 [Xanthobacteraceae bacterium]|nr:hypothetical protein [Xanthobacteraceae bacterium]